MARTLRNTAEYFPHDARASDGDTLTILESRFGNDGYAFWFKLLERLTCSNGHYIDCKDGVKWMLFCAKAHTTPEKAITIVETLAELKAIDVELWGSRIIWCQHLVDNIADVYRNRRREIPQRPIPTTRNAITTPDNAITTPDNTQSKVKESKVNNTILPEFIDKEIWNDYLKTRKKATEQAKALLIKKLEEFRAAGDDPNEVLKRSIMNGWTGIFPLDKKGGQSGAHRQSSRQLPKTYRTPEEIFGGKDG